MWGGNGTYELVPANCQEAGELIVKIVSSTAPATKYLILSPYSSIIVIVTWRWRRELQTFYKLGNKSRVITTKWNIWMYVATDPIWNWTLFLKTVHQLICVLTSVREYSMITHFCCSVVRGMFWWRLWDWTLVGWGHVRSSGQYLQFFSSSDVMRLVSSGSVDLDWTWHGISHIFVQITNHSHLPPPQLWPGWVQVVYR